MKEIKVKLLKEFDEPKGIFNNSKITGTDKESFAKKTYRSKNYQVAITPIGNGKATFAIPFQVGQNVAFAWCPNPILLYLDLSRKSLNRSELILEELKRNSDPLFMAHSSRLNGLIQEKSLATILLHTSLEAFVNATIPEDAQYIKKRKEEESMFGKAEIEKMGFDQKFKEVVKRTTGFDFFNSDKLSYNRILEFTKLRNDLVHLKSITDQTNNYYFQVFNELLHCDLELYFDSVVKYMNSMNPGLVEFLD